MGRGGVAVSKKEKNDVGGSRARAGAGVGWGGSYLSLFNTSSDVQHDVEVRKVPWSTVVLAPQCPKSRSFMPLPLPNASACTYGVVMRCLRSRAPPQRYCRIIPCPSLLDHSVEWKAAIGIQCCELPARGQAGQAGLCAVGILAFA
jgi:hypothetical protein